MLPVIAGLVAGIVFIIVVSTQFFSSPLQLDDFVKVSEGLASVKAFTNHYPNPIVTTNVTSFEAENAKIYTVYYTVSEPYSQDRYQQTTAVLTITFDTYRRPLVITINCNSENGSDYLHIGNASLYVQKFFERAKHCP